VQAVFYITFKKYFFILAVVFASLHGFTLYAQNFKLMRYDENYEYLKDSSRSIYEQVKYTPLNKSGSIYMSFGGEERGEFVDFNNEDWGRFNVGHNNFLLQRYDLHADVHFGSKFRVFAQLRSAFQDGSKTGSSPVDEDHLNVQKRR